MKIFLKKLCLFLIPIAAIFIFPIIIFIVGREYYSAEHAAETQMIRPETLFGLAYTDENKSYKEALIAKLDPEILVLGTSRSGQFRSDLFKKENHFGNASNAVTSISEMKQFIEHLPNSSTKIIMLGLDQEMFFKDIPKPDQNGIFDRFKNLFVASWKSPYEDYYYGKFSLSELQKQSVETTSIGLNALVNGRGFRSDGSFRDGKKLDETLAPQVAIDIGKEVSEIQNNRGSFLYGEQMRQKDLDDLASILELCKKRGIYAIGFLPPYPKAFYDEYARVDDIYRQQISNLPAAISDIFSQYHFGFFDFSDIGIVQAPDSEFSDIRHGTDKIYLRMTIYMAEKNKMLKQYVDILKLKKILVENKKDFLDVQ